MGNSVKPYGHTIAYKFGNIIFLKESENLFSPPFNKSPVQTHSRQNKPPGGLIEEIMYRYEGRVNALF